MNEWQPIETAPVGQRITLPQPRALPQLLRKAFIDQIKMRDELLWQLLDITELTAAKRDEIESVIGGTKHFRTLDDRCFDQLVKIHALKELLRRAQNCIPHVAPLWNEIEKALQ